MPENQVNEHSWINVSAFRLYVTDNRRYGLAAISDAPYLEGGCGSCDTDGISRKRLSGEFRYSRFKKFPSQCRFTALPVSCKDMRLE